MSHLILLVDDEPSIIQLARLYLEREGFRVISASDGHSALEMVKKHKPDLIVLDLMLPVLDGFEVCRKLRAEKIQPPIIMLTARDEDIEKILGLEMGADDYMTKPFNPRELVARVKAVLRRSAPPPVDDSSFIFRRGGLIIDESRREVSVNGIPLELRPQEFDLLLQLAQNHLHVLSREKLLELAWGYDYPGETRTVDVHIARLRKKLTGSNVHIETVTGIGYKLVG